MSFAYYGYNAANTRTYKLSLYNTNLWVNGEPQPLNLQWQNAMFYPNTYLNFNSNGEYTKHYYNGMERIASRLGENNVNICLNNTNCIQLYNEQTEERFMADLQQLVSTDAPVDMPPLMDVNTLQATGTPDDIFYYHTNHLGSTAFVTDNNATVTQGFLYAPFGEITTEYTPLWQNGVLPKYSFNAKELDEETGMYYYEARYYNPPVFTSRDPMFEKYFWMTPYAYCANNPIKYVDPSGKEPGDPFLTRKKAAKDWAKFYNGASIIRGHEFASSIYKTTINGKHRYTYTEAVEGTNDGASVSLPPNGEKIVAYIHSHGKYEENYDNNNFSTEDKKIFIEHKKDGYVSTPNGSLQKYNYRTQITTIISIKMDSDPNDPDRKNNKNPVDIPKELEDANNFINSTEIEFKIKTNVDYFQ